MKCNLLYCILFLFWGAFFWAPLPLAAAISRQGGRPSFIAEVSMPGDGITEEPSRQDEKQVKKKKRDQKPDVKEVPKSRRQPKPAAVKPKVKIKAPVKKVKPVIKKPFKLLGKNLGI